MASAASSTRKRSPSTTLDGLTSRSVEGDRLRVERPQRPSAETLCTDLLKNIKNLTIPCLLTFLVHDFWGFRNIAKKDVQTDSLAWQRTKTKPDADDRKGIIKDFPSSRPNVCF